MGKAEAETGLARAGCWPSGGCRSQLLLRVDPGSED